ncbi:hypothetical protein QL285_032577 [Trifolium repens]|nr:hypothetical protein QL285_032577 [Trifolium repens]
MPNSICLAIEIVTITSYMLEISASKLSLLQVLCMPNGYGRNGFSSQTECVLENNPLCPSTSDVLSFLHISVITGGFALLPFLLCDCISGFRKLSVMLIICVDVAIVDFLHLTSPLLTLSGL